MAHLPCGDFVYTLAAAGPLALVGTGSGHVHVVDAEGLGQVRKVGGSNPAGDDGGGEEGDTASDEGFGEPRILYSLGANQAAVRFVAPTANGMIAAGDDGTAIVYGF